MRRTPLSAEGVIVEVGLAPAAISATSGPAWTWSPAEAVGTDGSAMLYRGTVQPEAIGHWTVSARASTDGGVDLGQCSPRRHRS